MEKLLEILSALRPEVDFVNENDLLERGRIDSFDIVRIVGECNDVFDIEIDVDDLYPENFASAEAIWQLVCELREE